LLHGESCDWHGRGYLPHIYQFSPVALLADAGLWRGRRTHRGPVATVLAYKHFGLPFDKAKAKEASTGQAGLF